MVFTVLAAILLSLTLLFLRRHRAQQRRIATHRELPRERLLPGRYKSFTELENKLWASTEQYSRSADWDTMRIKLRPAELRLIQDYVQGLRKDFELGNRIFAVVIVHSPEAK